jgi:hypothetical protein
MKIVVGQGGIVIGRNGSLFEPALTSDVNRFTATMTNLLESNVVARTVAPADHPALRAHARRAGRARGSRSH